MKSTKSKSDSSWQQRSKISANATRLHDEAVAVVAKLLGSLRADAIVEPMRLFADAAEDASNQRPDAFLWL